MPIDFRALAEQTLGCKPYPEDVAGVAAALQEAYTAGSEDMRNRAAMAARRLTSNQHVASVIRALPTQPDSEEKQDAQ